MNENNAENQTVSIEEHLFYYFFVKTFVAIYYINLQNHSFRIYSNTPYLEQNYTNSDDYLKSITNYINKDVALEDREKILKIVQPEYINDRLKKEQQFSTVLKDTSNNREKYYRFHVIRGADQNHVAFGFVDVTKEYKQKDEAVRIIKKLDTYHETLVNASSGYLEVNLTKDKIIGDIIDVDENGVQKIITVPDVDKKFVSYNEFMKWVSENMLFSDKDEFLKNTSSEFLISQFNKGNKTFEVNVEFKKKREEQVHRYCRQTYYMSRDNMTNDIYAFCLVIDVTKQREELEKALELAKTANKVKSTFLFNMSHDIRTPMNAIIGFNNLALEYIDEKDILKDCLEKVKNSCQYLVSLINNIFDMSSIEFGKLKAEKEPVSILAVVDNIKNVFEQVSKTNGINLIFETDVTHEHVLVDKVHITRILSNIVGNAIKYTNENGFVNIKVTEKKSKQKDYAIYEFVVDDSGIGMSEQFLTHIYDAFSREQNPMGQSRQGTGLGMTITKELVNLMHGTIDIKSKIGVGTKVTVALELQLLSKERFELLSNCNSLKGKRILLVEDNELNRELTGHFLKHAGLLVDEAEDGTVAVKKCSDCISNDDITYYDLILMDIQMIVMDGLKATSEIRNIFNPKGYHIPIIAMTANVFEEDKQKALNAGMDDFLTKPIDPNKLIQTLVKFIK